MNILTFMTQATTNPDIMRQIEQLLAVGDKLERIESLLLDIKSILESEPNDD